jgi:ParB-like chromosome segregation protein Spo0J
MTKVGLIKKTEWPADKVERRPVADLIPYARNARTHSDAQVAQIAASVTEWGWTTPVLVDEAGSIIAGHGRVMAARKLGLADVPVMVATGWSEAQKKAYVLADNQLALNAGWDIDLLKVEVGDLDLEGFDLSLIGFDDKLLADLLADPTDGLTDPDEVPEPPAEPVTVLGDVWVMGKHRVMCGDSGSVDAIDRLLADEPISAILTDPPYGIGIDGQKESKNKNPKHNRKAHAFMGWDAERPDEGIFNYIVAADVPAVIWGGNYFADILPPTRGWLYWSKGQDGLTMSDGELAWTTETTPLRAITVNRSALKGSVHPTQKPLQIVEFSLDYIKAGPVVLDLFGGSGSTLIACEKTNRNARLMELAPQYCDVIVKRWQNFTGQKAVHEATGKTFDEMHNAPQAA